jgi:hypothetical protein
MFALVIATSAAVAVLIAVPPAVGAWTCVPFDLRQARQDPRFQVFSGTVLGVTPPSALIEVDTWFTGRGSARHLTLDGFRPPPGEPTWMYEPEPPTVGTRWIWVTTPFGRGQPTVSPCLPMGQLDRNGNHPLLAQARRLFPRPVALPTEAPVVTASVPVAVVTRSAGPSNAVPAVAGSARPTATRDAGANDAPTTIGDAAWRLPMPFLALVIAALAFVALAIIGTAGRLVRRSVGPARRSEDRDDRWR